MAYSLRKQGRDAVADFLQALEQQKAHWYSIILTAIPDDLDDCHRATFPSLSRLSNIDEDIIRGVLWLAGLARYTRNYGYSVMPLAWIEFI